MKNRKIVLTGNLRRDLPIMKQEVKNRKLSKLISDNMPRRMAE